MSFSFSEMSDWSVSVINGTCHRQYNLQIYYFQVSLKKCIIRFVEKGRLECNFNSVRLYETGKASGPRSDDELFHSFYNFVIKIYT